VVVSDTDLLRDIIGAYDVLGLALDPDTDEEAVALHDLAERGLCEHTPEGFVPTDAGRAASRLPTNATEPTP
jgi:hypothetical protein